MSWGILFIIMGNNMSESKEANRTAISAVNLPQFMNEAPKSVEIEEKPSWLNNNLHKLMIGVSVVWFAIVLIYITQFFGWDNLFLMMPDEFGGFLAGITLPLAIIWVVMAYIDRGTSFKQEAKFLRAYMNQLVYPEDGAPQTAKAMADAIRSQVVELQEVSKMATKQTAKIKDEIRENINEFSKLVATLDNYSTKTIVELSDGVKFLTKNFENITNKAQHSAETFSGLNREFASGANDIEQSLNNLFTNLAPKLNEIKHSAEVLQQISSASGHDIIKANEMLHQYNEQTVSNIKFLTDNLNEQSQNLRQLSENAATNCGLLKSTIATEVEGLALVLEDKTSRLENAINTSGMLMKSKVEELTKHTQNNISHMNEQVTKSINVLDGNIDAQIKKIDNGLSKNAHEIAGLVNNMEHRASSINKKLAEHGNVLAQEIDKLMVRSNNLEESITMQINKLANVSDLAVSSMQKVDSSLAENIESLQLRSSSAGNTIETYIEKIAEQTTLLEQLGTNIENQSSISSELLDKRHQQISNAISDAVEQIHLLNGELDNSTNKINESSSLSINSINAAAKNMGSYIENLNEATSVVVAQSQVSEASLAQQHKNITSSAAKVEEIKLDLKHQIDDLSSASSEIENSASLVVSKLKGALDNMLSSCNDVISKSRAINDNLTEQANQFDTSANRTLAKVTQFESILNNQNQNLEQLSKNVADNLSDIGDVLNRQNKEVKEASSSALAGFRKIAEDFESQSKSLHEISRSTAEYTSSVAVGFDEKAALLNSIFKQQENEFYSFCDKIADNASKMSDSLKQQIGIIEQSANKVFSQMVMLEEDTSRHTEAVVNNSHRSIDRLSEIEAMVANKNEIIRGMVDEVYTNLENISSKIQEHANVFNDTAQKINTEGQAAAEKIVANCDKLRYAENDLVNNTADVNKVLEENIKNIDLSMSRTQDRYKDINKMLEHQTTILTDAVNTLSTQSRLSEASMAQQYKYLTDTVTNVSQRMKEVNSSFQSNTDNIFETSTKLAYEFDVLGDRLIKVGEDINKTSKSAMKNIDQVNINLVQSSEDLAVTVKGSIDNMKSIFAEYEKYTAGFNTVTAETSTSVVEINSLISTQRDKMVQISDDTKKLVECFNTVLNDTSNKLAERANLAYDKVKGLGKDLKNLGMQMEEAAKVSATHMLQSGDKLRASVAEIAANAERISNDILNSGEVFVKQSGALVAATDDTVTKVNNAMGSLLEVSKDFNLQGDKIVKDAFRFNDIISSQIKELNEQTQKADSSLNNLSTIYQGIQIEGFLKQASSIIEKLESLSVDINRIFNPKDEDDLWKRYYNGDSGVFVRYLAKNLTKTQVSSVRKAFEENYDFRNQVNAYLSEFELLISSAKSHERSGLLLSVISGADIGKLYYVLAKIMDKLE